MRERERESDRFDHNAIVNEEREKIKDRKEIMTMKREKRRSEKKNRKI